jgi:hypothetical protein
LEDLDHVNRCAYFDYQREKVYLRTSETVRKACQSHHKQRKAPKLSVNRAVKIRSNVCPDCRGKHITRLPGETHSKLAYDLKFTAGSIRRQVIRCTTVRHRCEDCGLLFLPKRYKRLDKHQHALKSWAIYQHVVHRISFERLEVMFKDCFGLRIDHVEFHMMKSQMARRYQKACKQSLARIVAGGLAHADETHVNLQKGKGYVWALTNMEDVLYLYRPNREAGFLRELLRDFHGVLVSDFYSGYDSLPCEQQKCLVHLIRDFNADLKSHPYDEEFKGLATEFAKLLRSIIATIDRYGLKKYRLHKHKADVDRFFKDLAARACRSELAEEYQKRLIKNQGKLFTFLDHDGVPWNNNNAEHAIKVFASYRRGTDGGVKAIPLAAYLGLLSVYQTCKYRGVSFLKFMLSREEDVEVYCRRGRMKKRLVGLDIYPPGFSRGGFQKKTSKNKEERDQDTKVGTSRSGCQASGTTIAIGDIHGCSKALWALLEAVAPRRQDVVITLGNCIDHGPDSKEVVRLLVSLVRRCTLVPLMGEHEEMFLDSLGRQGCFQSWQKSGGDQTLRSYAVDHSTRIPRSHNSFINSFEDYHETATHLFVHAGYQPDLPLCRQQASVLRRRPLDAEWPGPHVSGKVAVVGHRPQQDGYILDLGHLVCIDTFCHGGGWLTALDVGSRYWWQANEKGEVRQGILASPYSASAGNKGSSASPQG